MKLGILVPSVGDYGDIKFYNSQEVGLARTLDEMCDEIIVYKAVPISQKRNTVKIAGTKNAILKEIPVRSIGINGLWDCKALDPSMNGLVCFSDTQLSVPRIDKWCKKHNIPMFPYIGSFESHSENKVKRFVINRLFSRNLNVFKKNFCLAKTPTVVNELKKRGVQNICLAPVGLDMTRLHKNYTEIAPGELKQKYGFDENDKIILFVGRMIDEKQPLHMLRIFSKLHRIDNSYRLLMVGQGPLEEKVKVEIETLGITEYIKRIKRIPNERIWELYRLADCYVNLNQQEIFGMAVLEAMYYGCKVVAWRAPGPELIIEDGVSGYLVDSDTLLCERIQSDGFVPENAKHHIERYFTWKNSAECIFKLVSREK